MNASVKESSVSTDLQAILDNQRSAFRAEGPVALATNLLKVAGMFFFAGDPAPWRNLPSRPALGQLWPIAPMASSSTLPRPSARTLSRGRSAWS